MRKQIRNAKELSRMGRRTGVATVELAIVLPVLTMLLFGVIEVGALVRDVSALNEVALGAEPGTAEARMAAVSGHLDTEQMTVLCEYRTFNEETETFGPWTALGINGDQNNAGGGDHIRVTLRYPHTAITGLFPGMTDGDDTRTMELDASATMRRE